MSKSTERMSTTYIYQITRSADFGLDFMFPQYMYLNPKIKITGIDFSLPHNKNSNL